MHEIIQNDYGNFLDEIKNQIRSHQYEAMRAVNRELVALYWKIGKSIHDKQKELGWGKSVVETLSQDLRSEFPGRNGFSARNLRNMKIFYETYSPNSIWQTLSAKLGWSKNVLILSKCKDNLEREFYLRATARFGWTVSVLQHQLENKSYEKHLIGQSNFDKTVPKHIRSQAILAVKDHYIFDFLELEEKHSERELEKTLVANLQRFLIELGGTFTFVGNQYRIEVGGQEFFIDLLLFHRRLQCLIAVELKVGEFKPEHKGKIEFYLEALARQEQLPHEQAPIGIVICKNKNETIVEYSLSTTNKPIGVASYTTTHQLPADYENQLPGPDEIANHLQKWDENH
jgi:predicted nuclease of restriction endonuclease-like (RecB) superfamily